MQTLQQDGHSERGQGPNGQHHHTITPQPEHRYRLSCICSRNQETVSHLLLSCFMSLCQSLPLFPSVVFCCWSPSASRHRDGLLTSLFEFLFPSRQLPARSPVTSTKTSSLLLTDISSVSSEMVGGKTAATLRPITSPQSVKSLFFPMLKLRPNISRSSSSRLNAVKRRYPAVTFANLVDTNT